jgi:small subunit ribosomal protein S20
VAHSLSAKKRVRQNAKRNAVNRARKSIIKTEVKKLDAAIKSGDAGKAQEEYKQVVKKLDTIAGTSTMHKNTAARKKSRLAKRLNAIKAKTA